LKRLRAFTIIELVVAMAISSIVVSIAYYSFFLLYIQFNKFREKSAQMRQFRLLSGAIMNDVEQADWIKDTLDNEHFVIGRGDTLILYSIDTNQVSRSVIYPEMNTSYLLPSMSVEYTQGVKDSFNLNGTLQKLWFAGDSTGLMARGLIKAGRLRIMVNRQDVYLSFNKQYSSQQIMAAENQRNE
jgi:prepilin-type N-terminal cleavage/methylation domain-containing protein